MCYASKRNYKAMNTYSNDTPFAVTESEKHWAAATHWGGALLAFMTSWAVGVAGFVVPLGVQILKGGESRFVAQHAKESMNFNLSMFIYAAIGLVIGFLLVGTTLITLGLGALLTLPAAFVLALAYCALAVLWLVCSIIGTIRAYEGREYHYPVTMRLIK